MKSNIGNIIKMSSNGEVIKNFHYIHKRFKESKEYKVTNVIKCGLNIIKNDRIVNHNGNYVINSFLPPLNSKAYKSIVDAVEGQGGDFFINHINGRRLAPISTYIAVTGRCMYKCWHCSAKRFIKDKDEREYDMSTADLKGIIKSLQDLGVGIIGFTGGEPLLRKDIEELINSIDDRSISLLFTNGFALDLEKAKKLQMAGLFGVGISLDSIDKEVYDKKRGHKGAYDYAVAAIKNCKEAGLYTMAQTVCTREMLETGEIKELAKYIKTLGVDELRILEPIPCGSLLDKSSEILTAEEKKELIKLHIEFNRDKAYPKTSVFPYIESKDQFGCGAGVQHSYIDSEGNFSPCDFVPENFGNVLKKDIKEIWDEMGKSFGRAKVECYAKGCNKCEKGELPKYYNLLAGKK